MYLDEKPPALFGAFSELGIPHNSSRVTFAPPPVPSRELYKQSGDSPIPMPLHLKIYRIRLYCHMRIHQSSGSDLLQHQNGVYELHTERLNHRSDPLWSHVNCNSGAAIEFSNIFGTNRRG
jgi:hypothetical protein